MGTEESTASVVQVLDGRAFNNTVPSTAHNDILHIAGSTGFNRDLSAFTSALNSFGTDPSLSVGANTMPDFDINIGADVNMDAVLDGDADWLSFMQLSGFSLPSANTSTTNDNGLEAAAD